MTQHYATTDDLCREVAAYLGDEATAEEAARITRFLRDTGQAPYVEPHGFRVDWSGIDLVGLYASLIGHRG